MDADIAATLLSLGFSPKQKGWTYIYELTAGLLAGKEISPLKNKGFADIAAKYRTTVQCVDKNIQNAVSCAWLRADPDVLYSAFGQTVSQDKGKPTVKQFIYGIAQIIRIKKNF